MPDKTMIALVKTERGPGNMELREVPVPRPKPDQVLIEIKACGICGTDLHVRADEHRYWPPVIMGHEYSGDITELGAEVEGWEVGERVVCEPQTLSCGVCPLCRQGQRQVCPNKRPPGWGIDGAFAKYISVPAMLLHRMPEGLSYDEAAVTEPTAIVVHAVLERCRINPGDTVVVLGPGPIGLLAAMAAKAGGERKVIVAGPDIARRRLEVARAIADVDEVINLSQTDLTERVLELTAGRGAEVVVEAAGAVQAVQDAFGLIARHGRICAIGITGKEEVSIPYDTGITKACSLIFNMSSSYPSWDASLGFLASRRIDGTKVISHRLPLDRWEEAFDLMERQEGIKVLLVP